MNNFSVSFSQHEMLISMRMINEADIEYLRKWKNDYKEFFFNKNDITIEQQKIWFDAYLLRPDDYMFVILAGADYVGCMGIRKEVKSWDAYNIINGNAKFKGSGIISACFKKMLNLAKSISPLEIGLKVLKQNPAVDWYLKQGLTIAGEKDEYLEMKLINKPL